MANILLSLGFWFCTTVTLSVGKNLNSPSISPQNIFENLTTNQDINSTSELIQLGNINLLANQLAILTTLEESKEHVGEYLSNVTELVEELRDEVKHVRADLGTLQYLMAFQVTAKSFVFEGRGFYVNVENKFTWHDAQSWCQDRGSVLAQPKANLTDFFQMVDSRIPVKENMHVWLGASDLGDEGEWKWLSGDTVDHHNIPWLINNPDNTHTNEHCMELFLRHPHSGNGINDNRCEVEMNFVCELQNQ